MNLLDQDDTGYRSADPEGRRPRWRHPTFDRDYQDARRKSEPLPDSADVTQKDEAPE